MFKGKDARLGGRRRQVIINRRHANIFKHKKAQRILKCHRLSQLCLFIPSKRFKATFVTLCLLHLRGHL